MMVYELSKIDDWGVGDGHVLKGFQAYNKPASTDTQAFCDHLYTGEKPDVINEAQRKVSKQDPSLLWLVSSRGCRRRTASYLLDADERSEPFSTGTPFCDNCDVCVSRLVDCGGPGKLLGVDISLTQPFRVSPVKPGTSLNPPSSRENISISSYNIGAFSVGRLLGCAMVNNVFSPYSRMSGQLANSSGAR